MTLAGNLLLNFYSIAVLVYIMVYSRMNTGRKDRSYRLFMDAVYILFIMLIADCMGRLDGRPDTWFAPLNQAGNFLTYLLNPVIAMVWLLYVHAQTGRTRLQTRRLQHVLIGIFVVQAALTLATLWTGWFYRIDADNVYHRGPLYLMSVLLPALLILAAEAFVWYERKRIARAFVLFVILSGAPVRFSLCERAAVWCVPDLERNRVIRPDRLFQHPKPQHQHRLFDRFV